VEAIAAFGEREQRVDVLLSDFARSNQFLELVFHSIM
jgi:hypothetical protein